MSRRKGEFEHRTSIFEGAYRAWSHLGGCDPEQLKSHDNTAQLDPLNFPHINDNRAESQSTHHHHHDNEDSNNPAGPGSGYRMIYYYEPLPRSGINHPFVQGIIAPWLGQEADDSDVKQGLSTLRTWWQHRRKGESASALKSLGTSNMKTLVEAYTRHFFLLALNMVINDHEQPPRSLQGKFQSKTTDTMGSKSVTSTEFRKSTTTTNTVVVKSEPMGAGGGGCCGGGGGGSEDDTAMAIDDIVPSNSAMYGNPNRTPVVFVSANGDIQIALSIKGITCTQCVKMIETVLQGTSDANTIEGLLDAVGDKDLSAVIIKIAQAGDAKRIAHKAGEVLSMVGYTAVAKEMDVIHNSGVDLLTAACDVVKGTDQKDVFDWTLHCNCPDNGVIRKDCVRHSQMNKRIFEAFDKRETELKNFVAGCGKSRGLKCSCAPGTCKCRGGCCNKNGSAFMATTSTTNPTIDLSTNSFLQLGQFPTSQLQHQFGRPSFGMDLNRTHDNMTLYPQVTTSMPMSQNTMLSLQHPSPLMGIPQVQNPSPQLSFSQYQQVLLQQQQQQQQTALVNASNHSLHSAPTDQQLNHVYGDQRHNHNVWDRPGN